MLSSTIWSYLDQLEEGMGLFMLLATTGQPPPPPPANDLSLVLERLESPGHVHRFFSMSAFILDLLLNFTVSWGDSHYLGLTGLEVVGKGGQAIPFSVDQIFASPRDLNDLVEYTDDCRTLDK